jgi:hypothetical protein
MAKDPDQRYTTTVELAAAAHDAITEPNPRPPVQDLPHTEPEPLPDVTAIDAGPPPATPSWTIPIPCHLNRLSVGRWIRPCSRRQHRTSPSPAPPQARRPLLKRMSLRARIGVGVAVDGAGNIYVTDSGNHRVLKLPAGGIG